ncbi:MAG: alkaline phosphatase family protein [Candidatus Bathyarchaeota archaeon]|nr:MAG: alkaline phosphatase family protein [Candidatus Bathyarchaeota archaeon]
MKVLVLGFDGASQSLVARWIDHLPNFKLLKDLNIFGQTIPPIPAQTPVAWTTFMTGKNPGNHGIFSFAFRQTGTYKRKIIDPRMLKSKTLWQILSEAGKRVGVLNVPMCDCCDIKGFMIPGFMSRSEGIPYPDSVREKIKRKFGIKKFAGDLEIATLEKAQSDPELFFERVNQMTDCMAEICLYLFEEEEWDFFMPVFMGLDRIQHFFWKNIDSTHPKFEENKLSNLVENFYVKADRIVGNFLKLADENTLVIVLSDHGFCSVHREVIINNYLEEKGFLTTNAGKIDLEKSKAVSYGYGDIWLNVKQREPQGIIDLAEEYDHVRTQISTELKKIEIDGEKPIKDVKKREELWWGTYLNQAPDLNIIFNIGYQAARQPEITEKNELKRYVNDSPRWSGGHDGTHDPLDVLGIIGILGPGIKGGKDLRIHLWDLAPTILNWMNVPIPADMDGRPIRLKA